MHEILFSLYLILTELQNREVLRFEYSMEQGYDTSCGLSALACFLELYWSESTSENELAAQFLSDKIIKGDLTISFADIKRILELGKFKVAAYKMNYDQLEKAVTKYAPLFVHYNKPEGHYAIVLGMSDGKIVTADPAEGTIEWDRTGFEKKWSGYVLLAAKPGKTPEIEMMHKAIDAARGRRNLAEQAILPYVSERLSW